MNLYLQTRRGLEVVKTSRVSNPGAPAHTSIGLNDFTRLWADVGSQAEAAFSRVGQRGFYVLGQEVADFEQALADYSGVAHVCGCASGLDAIELGLRAGGLQPGQPVLTTPLSAFATTLAILRAGGRPLFVDVDQDGLMDLDAAEQALQADPELRAVVPVHLYGRSLDLDRLERLRRQFNLLLVEDMAQSVGASWQGRPVGSVGQSAALSFYPTKNLGCLGDGGAVLSNDPEIAQRCRGLRDYGQTAKYVHAEPGLNSRLDELQAALLHHAMLPRLKHWTERRRELAQQYQDGIKHPRVTLPRPCQESVWHLYVVQTEQRESLREHLAACGIGSAVHYPLLISEQQALRGVPVSPPTPRAEQMARTVLSLPIHPYLSEAEVRAVIDAVNGWKA
jgi:dTDP-4-amino-4,6-dideoxygalactose transaminase